MSSYSVTYGRNGQPQRPDALPAGFGELNQSETAQCAIAKASAPSPLESALDQQEKLIIEALNLADQLGHRLDAVCRPYPKDDPGDPRGEVMGTGNAPSPLVRAIDERNEGVRRIIARVNTILHTLDL